jgi:hypothetical protein
MIRSGLEALSTPRLDQEPRSLLPANLRRAAKRSFDAAASLALLVLLSPLFLVLIAIIRRDGGSAFYSHRRIGRGGASFGCLKFRSMAMDADQRLAEQLRNNPADAAEWATRRKLKHDPRITPLGAILRQTSLDELPQLINVLRGEMSLVGPRPVVAEELQDHYGRVGARAYLAVTPGITGLWQVSGRSGTSYTDRVALDMDYAQRPSLRLDLTILLRTVPAVLARRGAV